MYIRVDDELRDMGTLYPLTNNYKIMNNKKIKTNTYELCDITRLEIGDVFPSPTEEQIKKWNRIGDDGDEFDGCIENHYDDCIGELKKKMKEL